MGMCSYSIVWRERYEVQALVPLIGESICESACCLTQTVLSSILPQLICFTWVCITCDGRKIWNSWAYWAGNPA